MNTKSKLVGIKVHNAIGSTFKAIGRNVAKGAKVTYTKALTPAGHGIKAAAVSVKDFGAGLVLGERNIAEEQKQLLKEKLAKLESAGVDPNSMLYKSLEKSAD